MTPEEVPQDLVTAGWRAIRKSRYVFTEEAMRVVLAATLTLHEQQVRERIAAELSVMFEPEPPDNYAVPAWHDGYETAMEAAVRMVGRVVEDGSEEAGERVP